MNEFDENNNNEQTDISEMNDTIDENTEDIPAYENKSDEVSTPDEPSGAVLNGAPAYSAPTRENAYNDRYSEITYTPAKTKKEKKKKEPKTAKLSTVIIICAVSVLLCGAVCFAAVLTSLHAKVKPEEKTLVVYKDATELVPDKNADNTPIGISSLPDGESYTYAQVAALVKSSVVEINTEFTTRSMWFQYVNGGAGSGVILSEDGYIITNAHVVMNSDETALADTITVRLADGTEYGAEVKGYDNEADIAVLKIEAEGLTPVQCGNSDNLAVGEEVLVVGNPLGELGGSVTNGIISSTEREIEVNGTKMKLIQTNAAVNPGNSGGGMFNMRGQLVGIVNAKSSGQDIEGIGFAIPANNALSVTEQLMEYGYVRGKIEIGVQFRLVQQSNYSSYYNIRPGIYVEAFTKDYNDGALKIGDRIIAIDGNEVSTLEDISSIVRASSVGDKLKFQFYRDGKLTEAEVTCYEKLPEDEKKEEESTIDFGNGFNASGDAPITEIPPDDGYYYSDPFGFDDFFGNFFGW